MFETHGFTNIHLINLALRELFLRLRPQRMRQFVSDFELTNRETDKSVAPIIRVQRIARRLADHYRISVSTVVVTFRSNMYVPGRVELSPASEFFIELHSEHRDALIPTVAILAHEVAHIFLHREGILLEPTFHNEVLTDTTAVFLGCGPAILNAATMTTTTSGNVETTTTRKFGYLSVDEFGYVQAKREAFFGLRRSSTIIYGLSRSGYRQGCRREKGTTLPSSGISFACFHGPWLIPTAWRRSAQQSHISMRVLLSTTTSPAFRQADFGSLSNMRRKIDMLSIKRDLTMRWSELRKHSESLILFSLDQYAHYRLNMRKVFEHPAFHEVGLLESVLNSHDIATIIRNQNVSSLVGEVPFTAAYPELWIVDDSRYDEAISVLQDFRDRTRQDTPAVDWACPECGESVPGTFHSCWKCDSPKPADLA